MVRVRVRVKGTCVDAVARGCSAVMVRKVPCTSRRSAPEGDLGACFEPCREVGEAVTEEVAERRLAGRLKRRRGKVGEKVRRGKVGEKAKEMKREGWRES